MSYRILDHTADVRLLITGKTPEELFKEALNGMMEILKAQPKSQSDKVKRTITVESPDLTALLVDFLNEVLWHCQSHKEAYSKVTFPEMTDSLLKAELTGLPVQEFGEDIKAVTYHEAEVKKNKDGLWETGLVFDI